MSDRNNQTFKSMELTEDQLGDLSAVAAQLFGDANDPRSAAYVRQLERPTLRPLRIALFALIPFAVCALLIAGAVWLGISIGIGMAVACAVFVTYCAIIAKRTAICLVRIYQRFAPDSVRNKCRFEPSCSSYMIRAIEKYGLFRGVRKGIRRLRRCNVHDGGYDEP